MFGLSNKISIHDLSSVSYNSEDGTVSNVAWKAESASEEDGARYNVTIRFTQDAVEISVNAENLPVFIYRGTK